MAHRPARKPLAPRTATALRSLGPVPPSPPAALACARQARAREAMGNQRWEVVGGADKGGIVVRAGRELTSQQLPQKLETAALVEQLERIGDRVHYRLLEGQGPEEGWVSVRLKDKPLLEPRPSNGQAA
eukprot:CAMPEP_0115286208 /NCGR_PEP_ID=MMETSP0270-20121206/61825_1 /TAXON_ID=71861 /ORGANISM="Scrippsiella trochoidea, Strain CCMP3099" /LENGTH=128 /DNA_ID=CAMNT_0002703249 /DNA_START=13 /DNA_END=396 /DNA_ORIENTATION=+